MHTAPHRTHTTPHTTQDKTTSRILTMDFIHGVKLDDKYVVPHPLGDLLLLLLLLRLLSLFAVVCVCVCAG